MKKITNKIISLILALLTVISLSSCLGKNEAADPSDDAEEWKEYVLKTATDADTENAEPKKDVKKLSDYGEIIWSEPNRVDYGYQCARLSIGKGEWGIGCRGTFCCPRPDPDAAIGLGIAVVLSIDEMEKYYDKLAEIDSIFAVAMKTKEPSMFDEQAETDDELASELAAQNRHILAQRAYRPLQKLLMEEVEKRFTDYGFTLAYDWNCEEAIPFLSAYRLSAVFVGKVSQFNEFLENEMDKESPNRDKVTGFAYIINDAVSPSNLNDEWILKTYEEYKYY